MGRKKPRKAIKTEKKPGVSLLGPSALARVHTCAHFWRLQCFADATEQSAPDAGAQRRIDRGNEFEAEVVAKLSVVRPTFPENRPWEGHAATVALMREGAPLIYQGPLVLERLMGVPDLLQKTNDSSALGAFSYIRN